MALFTIEWVGNATGSERYYSRTYPEGDSETFKKGALLEYDDSEDGVVEVDLSSGVPAAKDFIGIALQDASGTSDTDIDVLIVQTGDIFSAMLSSDPSTLVAPTDDNVIGELFGLQRLATAATNSAGQAAAGTEYAIDTGATDWVKVLDYDPRDSARRNASAVTTTNYVAGDRVLFQFLNSILDGTGRQS